MINIMSTASQYEEIKKMHWYQQAEASCQRRLNSAEHWWVLVWSKSKKWTECVKCNLIASQNNLNTQCTGEHK